jgi:hypothetical protein
VNPAEIRTLLIERAETIDGTRPERLDDLFGRIRRHQRRRTAAAVAAASCLVLAVVVGTALLTSGPAHVTNPVPPATSAPADPKSPALVRKVTYTDQYWPTRTIQHGDRRVDIRKQVAAAGRKGGIPGVVHMDVTDGGVVFTTNDGKIWFTDGSAIHQIGKGEGYFGYRAAANVVSGTAGSRVAWIAGSDQHAEIVVYDTKADREAARVPVPDCTTLDRYRAGKPYPVCELTSLVKDDHVYFTLMDWNHLLPDVLMRLEVPTRTLERATADELAADLASASRGLIVGDSPETGVVSDGYGVLFAVKGERLVVMRLDGSPSDSNDSRTSAFDSGTRQLLDLRVPAGYNGADEFTAFEWIDDDRLALMNAANSFHQTTGDILVCRISTGRCEVAAPARPEQGRQSPPRVAPHLGLPG